MKPILLLLMMAGVTTALAADAPKASHQRSAEEISKEIEALQNKIKALDEEKKALLRKSSDNTIANIKTAIVKGRKILLTARPAGDVPRPSGEYGYVIVTPANVGVIMKDVELHSIDYMTPTMSMEMAERHSAEKIKAQVKEADEKAKRILDGNPPSQVHGN